MAYDSTPAERDASGLPQSARQCLDLAIRHAFTEAKDDGHWCGELGSNASATAEYIFLRQALRLDQSSDASAFIQCFVSDQQADGSWTLAKKTPGNLSVTAEVYLALKILGLPVSHDAMARAREHILVNGGVEKVRVLTRFFFAGFGLFPWDALPELPVELILMPSWAPINVYRFASWARDLMIPMTIYSHHKPIFPLPSSKCPSNEYIDELWLNPMDKNVPYTKSLSDQWSTAIIEVMSTAVDRAIKYFNGMRFAPTRSWARREVLQWILQHQEPEGDFAGIYQIAHPSILALVLEGYNIKHPRIKRALTAVEESLVHDTRGKRIQAVMSPVWDTYLMCRALFDAGVPAEDSRMEQAIIWLRDRQIRDVRGDWAIYNPQLRPAGWSFQYHNRWNPDNDDTMGPVIAMLKHDSASATSEQVLGAIDFILGMQNDDGGWASFDKNNNSLFLNQIPFSDMGALCDPSTLDLTSHILEGLGLFLHALSKRDAQLHATYTPRIKNAVARAIKHLIATQESNGSWWGRWGVNYIYGTMHVLCGLAWWTNYSNVSPMIAPALDFLKAIQNADGGWGESVASYDEGTYVALSHSTASQTAWAVRGLLAHLSPHDDRIVRGVDWLVRTQIREGDEGTWEEEEHTGVGFPKHIYLKYELYPHYWPMMALGQWVQAIEDEKIDQKDEEVGEEKMEERMEEEKSGM